MGARQVSTAGLLTEGLKPLTGGALAYQLTPCQHLVWPSWRSSRTGRLPSTKPHSGMTSHIIAQESQKQELYSYR